MIDTDTFVTLLYVLADDFCKANLSCDIRPGPNASLSRSEVITLAVFGQWTRFESERGFYRFAQKHLRCAFPSLPHRSQLNRLIRRYREDIVSFSLYFVELLQARTALYEIIDSSAVVTRDAKRRGSGWLPGLSEIGWSNRIGWYEGMRLLSCVNPSGIITGFGFAPANVQDRPLAETFFALRHTPHPALQSVGQPAHCPYVADKGFAGKHCQQHWREDYGAQVITSPRRNSKTPWPKAMRRWLARIRQIIETVYDKLHNTFRLSRERPHHLTGLQARLAAKIALHNFCIWLNVKLGRPRLAFADLLDW